MNRKVLVIVLALMATAMLTASVSTALAVTTNIDNMYAGGNTVVDVPGHTRIRLYMWHMDGNYYSGKADRIQIFVDTGTIGSDGLPVFKAVSGYENNPTRHAFSVSLGTGFAEHLVKPWQIGIFRIGKTSIIYWTVPMVAPATDDPTPQVTIPPGVLVLEGHGELLKLSVSNVPIGNQGWKYSVDASPYNAETTLFCPGWGFCGRVAEAFVGTSLEAKSLESATWTWTHA